MNLSYKWISFVNPCDRSIDFRKFQLSVKRLCPPPNRCIKIYSELQWNAMKSFPYHAASGARKSPQKRCRKLNLFPRWLHNNICMCVLVNNVGMICLHSYSCLHTHRHIVHHLDSYLLIHGWNSTLFDIWCTVTMLF